MHRFPSHTDRITDSSSHSVDLSQSFADYSLASSIWHSRISSPNHIPRYEVSSYCRYLYAVHGVIRTAFKPNRHCQIQHPLWLDYWPVTKSTRNPRYHLSGPQPPVQRTHGPSPSEARSLYHRQRLRLPRLSDRLGRSKSVEG